MTDANDLDLPRGVALAWGIAAEPARGPKREMSVERIVEAAMDIADADGLGAVSMAAVAGRLGYTPMSLYRYVSAKDDLIQLMMEAATGLPPADIADEPDWRSQLVAMVRAQVGVFLRHPWVLDIPITGSPATPNSAAHMDAGLAALAATPLDAEERLAAVLMLTGHARWHGTIIAAYSRRARESGMGPAEISEYEHKLFAALITPDAYPALHEAVTAGVFRSEADPFVFGLERMLDGLEAYVAHLAAGGARATAPAAWPDEDPAAVASDKRVREARKAVRDAEKALRDAHRAERQALADARAKHA